MSIIKGYLPHTIIELTDANMIKVTLFSSSGHEVKYMTFDDLAGAVEASKNDYIEKEIKYISPILPPNCIQYIETDENCTVVIKKPKGNIDFEYGGKVYKNVGYPNLIFAFKMYQNTVQRSAVCAVKDIIIKPDTEIYFYPFSNARGCICWGSNKLPKFDSISSLGNLTDIFLTMPNSNHSYGDNLSGLEYRPILESLENKEFPDEWLKKSDFIYSTWVNSFM